MSWHSGEMRFKETALTPVRVEWECPIAGCQGFMEANGEAGMTNPPAYHHKCSVCAHMEAIYGKRYPEIEFREIS